MAARTPTSRHSYYGSGAYSRSSVPHQAGRTTADNRRNDRRLTAAKTEFQNQTTSTNWDEQLNQAYAYDPAGNVTLSRRLHNGSTVANECFKYDGLRELTEAWTTTATTCQSTPSMSAVGARTRTGPATSTSSPRQPDHRGQARHARGHHPHVYIPELGATSVRPTISSVAARRLTTTIATPTTPPATSRPAPSPPAEPDPHVDPEGHVSMRPTPPGPHLHIRRRRQPLVAIDPQGTTVYFAGSSCGCRAVPQHHPLLRQRRGAQHQRRAVVDVHRSHAPAPSPSTPRPSPRPGAGSTRTATPAPPPASPGLTRGFVNGTIDNTA